MTVISSKDLDRAMGQGVDPRSIPQHNGGEQGVMPGHFLPGTDTRIVQQGHGARGAPVYDANELPPTGFYGGTVVSVSDAPPVEPAMDPNVRPKAPPNAPRSVADLLGGLGLRPPK